MYCTAGGEIKPMIRGNGLGVTNLFSSGSVLGRNATVSKLLEEALACGQLELEEGGTGKLLRK